MSYKEVPELAQFVLHNVEKTGRNLGRGAFGDVEELLVAGTFYAGKLLHPAFLDPQNLGVSNILSKFVRECHLLASIHHPNIVKFIGVCFFGENPYPVLVMEKLDASLDDLLVSKNDLSFSLKLQILCDISVGLVYLHGRNNPIIHRDLTTRNVLVRRPSMTAKIADLGNASIIDKTALARRLTQVPGTQVYMPPEALGRDPDYTTSLDIFSFGHLTLYTVNGIFPGDLLSPTFLDQHTHTLCPRSEVNRRKEHIDMMSNKLGLDHTLTLLVKQCLANAKEERPDAVNIMTRLKELKQQYQGDFTSQAAYVSGRRAEVPTLESTNPHQDDSPATPKLTPPGALEKQKVSGALRKVVWKKSIFQLEGSLFQRLRERKVKEAIDVQNITSVLPEESSDGIHFPFVVNFMGKGSPWNLRAYSQQERDRWISALSSHIPAPKPIRKERSDEYPKPYEVPISTLNRNPAYSAYDDVLIPKATPAPKVPLPQEHIYQDPQHTTASQGHQKALPTLYNSLLHTGSFGGEGVKPKASQYDHTSSKYHALQHDTGKFPEPPETSPTSKGPTYTYIDDYDFSTAGKNQSKEEKPETKRKSSSSDHYFPMAPYFDADKPPLRAFSQSTPHPQSQPHELPPPPPPPAAVHDSQHHTPREGSADVLPDISLTREQLLAYIQAFQCAHSQPDSHLEQGNPADMRSEFVPVPPKRSELYVNVMEANFDQPPKEIPPPLPPRPRSDAPKALWTKSSQDFAQLHSSHEHGNTASTISKSHSVVLQGSSAEAIRQRYNNRTRNPSDRFRPNVRFQFVEESEDEVFTQGAAVRHTASSEHLSEQCPPVPPRPRKSEEREYQNFDPAAHRSNIPKRSQTMKAYLSSEVDYRRKYMHGTEGRDHWSDERPQPWQGQSSAESNDPSAHSTMPMEEVLGKALTNAKMMSSDKYLNIMDDDEEEKPEWATCMSGLKSLELASTPEESLESLKQLALFIDRNDLYDMSQIGKGQFGKVYRAKLHRGNMYLDVAIKTIKSYESEHERAEFLREQAIMAQMAHPNVVRLYGLVTQDSPWIVLEYLPIGDLKQFLIRNTKPIKTLVKYMLDVALGMHYIAEKGFIHRDIAARNIMVGYNEVCKVGDFGLLRELPKDEEIYVSATRGPAPIRWMAPESLEKREFSTASDVWSYGVLLWEMYQPSKTPYEKLTNLQCGLSVIKGSRLEIPNAYPSKVRKIMRACWLGDPTKRPSFLLIFNILTLIIFTDFAQ